MLQLMVADEARDAFDVYGVIDIKREGQSLVIVTGPLTYIVAPFDTFAEAVMEFVGNDEEEKRA